MNKDTVRSVEKNIEGVVVSKYSTCVLNWVALKQGCKCALICGAPQIEVRILFERDACTVRITAEIPKNLWKCRSGSDFLWV